MHSAETLVSDANYRIISLDPGGTTGWATFTATRTWEGDIPEFSNIQYNCGQIGPYEHHKRLSEWLTATLLDRTIIVCETFHWRNSDVDKVEPIALEYIGVVKLFYNTLKTERPLELYWQHPPEGKIKKASFVRKPHLYKLGLYKASQIHAMDAYGHLLYWVINKGGSELAEVRQSLLERAWK